MTETPALTEAIARSFTHREPDRRAVSPLCHLGRRRLSGWEVLAQSVATTAPAASMVLLPTAMLTSQALVSGVIAVVAATVFVTLIAWCVSQFTRRMVAAGGLYAFVAQGLGARAALVTGVAVAIKYLGSGAVTLYHGGQAVVAVAAQCGVQVPGAATTMIHAAIAAVILVALMRGVRFAAVTILVIEVCSLVFIIGSMTVSGTDTTPTQALPDTGSGALLPVVLTVLFALAGFESATFVAPEARRPMITVTRTVLVTPVICGVLFVFAGWAAWSGRADTLVGAFLHGTASGASPLLVVLLHLGMGCSWLASAMASSTAASRLLHSMGVEGVLPGALAVVHRDLRTPWVALAVSTTVLGGCAAALAVSGQVPEWARVTLRVVLLVTYVLLAVAAVVFLARIRELTGPGAWGCGTAAVAGTLAAGYVVGGRAFDGHLDALFVMLAVPAAASLWYLYLRHRAPVPLAAVGVFDTPESHDVLPGAGVFAENTRGTLSLVGTDHPAAGPR